MDRSNLTQELVTIEELVVLSGKSRRTIERKLDSLKKNDTKTYKEITAHDISSSEKGGRPRLVYKRDDLLQIISSSIQEPPKVIQRAKPLSRKKVQYITEEKQDEEQKKTSIDIEKLSEEEKYTIVVAVCDQFEKCNIKLPDACKEMGITLSMFYKIVSSSSILSDKWQATHKNWMNTHGSILEYKLYTGLIYKLTPRQITKTVTSYVTREEFQGEELVTKRILIGVREINEEYIPDAASFMMGKKLLEEIQLMNEINKPNVNHQIEGKSIEELEELERKLHAEYRQLKEV